MAIEIFNRIENKYLMTSGQYNILKQTLQEQMLLDDQGIDPCYTISNIYYDTKDDYLIKHSLSKPDFKEKLRIRAYGQVTLDSMVFIELKKKINGVVNKRRSKIRLKDAYKMIKTKQLPQLKSYHNELVLREIQFFLGRYDLKASTVISYDRCAYKQDEFRVTSDSNIQTRKDNLRLENGGYGDLLLEEDFVLLEAKSTGAFPIWFVTLLSQLQIYKSSFSKYGKDYIRRHKTIEERGVAQLCWTQYLATHQKRLSH
ncbi:MAG: polyphosphate polymerase domain-containing protein [Clostridiales bacterium]|nr:polyphosphate polymerase domain-containing protein [Clostridiales bacterium]